MENKEDTIMAKTGKPIKPAVYFHPGVFLTEKLQEMEMSEKQFAEISGLPEKTITLINSEKMDIDSSTAATLEKATRIPATLWLKLQENYNIYRFKKMAFTLFKGLTYDNYPKQTTKIHRTLKRMTKMAKAI
ncbi:MAG: hypothetical protein IKP73_09830 [Bacteroidales bacterium]|nr:hypothetical protein [Bacteroidales bacterium]